MAATPGPVLLVSCYELGHQPFAIASARAQLEHAGLACVCVDASIEPVEDALFEGRSLVAFSVPMHTALRLGIELARRARAIHPGAHVCFFGLYAALNAQFLLGELADSVIGGEFEGALVALARALSIRLGAVPLPESLAEDGVTLRAENRSSPLVARPVLRRLAFEKPRREGLPPLERYAALLGPTAGERRTVGYVEASRGCLHRCLHCPITPVYEGRFFIVPKDIVLADAEQQIDQGARHITFGDPDFMNGVGHSMAIARTLHERHPEVTFDVTIKVEHLLRHRARLPELARLGCIFIVSAVESLSDRVLSELEKGHTRQDVVQALALTEAVGIALRPSFVAFTPWTTREDYVELCDFIFDRGLVEHVDPIQMAIRLLIPPGSALLARGAADWLEPLVPEQLGHRWKHPDPVMDWLHAEVSHVVERSAREGKPALATFVEIRELAHRAVGRSAGPVGVAKGEGRFVPRLTEPWFCCAEPSAAQMSQVSAPCGSGSSASRREIEKRRELDLEGGV